MVQEALRLVEEAAAQNATLRLFGGVAVELLVPHQTLERGDPRDIDCVGLRCELPSLLGLFASFGYQEDLAVRRLFGMNRRLFRQPDKNLRVDLCLDILLFCRPIDVRPRLRSRDTTLSVADLLLSKLQAHEMTDSDIADVVNLFAAYRPGRTETEDEFDLHAFAKECCNDWGLYQLVVDNMKRIFTATGRISRADQGAIKDKILKTGAALQSAPKTLRWRLRSVIGKHASYYNDVDREDL